MLVLSLGWDDPLEDPPPAKAGASGDAGSIPGLGRSPGGSPGGSPEVGMATHFSILAWRIPWTEDLGRLPFIRSQKFGHD